MVDFANEIVYEPHFGFTNKDWLKGWTYSYEDGPRLNYKTMRITDVVFDSTFYWDTLYFDISNMEVASDIGYNWSKRKEIGDEYLDQDSFLKIQKIASMLRKKYKRPDLEIREVGHGEKGVYGNGREYVEEIRFEISLRSKTYYAESSKSEGDLLNEIIEDVFREFKIKKSSPRSYDDILESQPKDGEDDVFIAHGSRRFRCSFDGKGKCFELSKAAMSDSLLKYVSDNDYGLWRYFPTEETKDKVKAYQEKLRKKFDLPIELFVKETYHDEEYGYEPSLIMGVSVGKSEKNEMLGRKKAESHADRQLEESIKRTKLSAIRTGLAITTFGIVMLNLWINRKQSQQIDNLNKKD